MIAALSKLAAARLVSRRRLSDPLEHLAWVESGAPFEAAGISGFLDGVPPDVGRVSAVEVEGMLARLERAGEALGDLYMKVTPRGRRHAGGEYYTPPWLVDLVLDRCGFGPEDRLIDPMCGAGAFLVAAIARLRRARPQMTAPEIARRVCGMDVNPAAVVMARAAYLGALQGCPRARLTIPVQVGDAILSPPLADDARFDVVAGNPPWIGWESLAPDYRAATRDLWRHHGLFPDGGAGMKTVLGRGKKDLSMLATFAAADRLLGRKGRLGFVIAAGVFKSVGGGAGFRRFELGDGTPLRVTRVDDLGARAVFAGAASRAAILALVKGERTVYPVPYHVWGRADAAPEDGWAEPVDPNDAAAAWITGTRQRIDSVRRVLGPSAYRARAGAYTGGANGVYWLRALGPPGLYANMPETGKRTARPTRALLESDLIFPLLRSGDVSRFEARPSASILLPQDPVRRRGIDGTVMASRYPLALDYLTGFRDLLAERRDRGTRCLVASGAPFYSIFSVTADTMAPWKVVWPRIATRVVAAAVGPREGRPVIPQETCTFIACAGDRAEEEAMYLAGVLNSSLFNEAAAAFAQAGGKSFGAPHLLRRIAVPRFDPHRAPHRAIAALVRQAGASLPQDDLDRAAAAVWELSCRE